MSIRQVLVFTSLDTHRAIDIPTDMRSAIERFTSKAPT
jgi:acyl-CoA thioesterase FadM